MNFFNNRFLVFFYLLLSASTCYGQNPSVAWSKLQDGKWEKAHRILERSLRKDSSSLEANYVLANWFFAPANPSFHVDSAYRYAIKSIRNYDSLSIRDKDRMQKFPIDSLILYHLKEQIDSAAFARAKLVNTETGYLRFIKAFPTATQISSAVELRDEVSFLEALKINTYQSFQAYLSRYPQSHRAGEATARYERLLFEERTKDKKLSSFKSFLSEFPASPYAEAASQQVFEIATASGEPNAFFNYLQEFPGDNHRKFVNDLLFHIYKEREEPIPGTILTDSLKRVIELDARFWIPFLRNGEFGFMDQTGEEQLPAQFQNVHDEYKCGPVVDDILILPDGYYSRTGKKIANPSTPIQGIGSGFLTLEDAGCLTLMHKSGRTIIRDCYQEFKLVDDNFIAAKKDGFLTLYTLSGRMLPLAGVTEVDKAEGLILLSRSGRKVINTVEQLAALADGNSFHDELVFDEVVAVGKNLVLVRISGLEGILDTNLKYVVPLGRHTLTKTSFGLLEKQNDRISVLGLSPELENKTYQNITYHRNWMVLEDAKKIQLFDIPTKRMVVTDADSVWFDRSMAFINKNKEQKVYLSSTYSIDLQPDSKIHFINSRDSVQFFFTENKNKNTVFSLDKGVKLFVTEYLPEESIGVDYFIVSKGSNKGVLGRNGKPVVPVEMNAIIPADAEHLSLLKEKKFGLFDLQAGRYFKPIYERNLLPIDKKNMIVYKNGFYGLIDIVTKPITPFEFSEVQAWGDSLIWVKKDFQWKLINYHTQRVLLDQVKRFTWIKNTQKEKIVIVYKDGYYGVISNQKGVVVTPSFTEIINLGTADTPFYFTEKYVEEASIYIVVYFDQTGKLVRKQAYEEEEYDRILCEDQ